MFLQNSRYAKVATVETTTGDGRTVAALVRRRLPDVAGVPHAIREEERLDTLAQDRYDDATRFWHIADANTALDSRTLSATAGATILVPET